MPRLRRPRSPVHLLRQVTAGLLAVLALALAVRPAEPVALPPADVDVLVAATDLVAGAVLTAADLRVVALPASAAPDGVATDVGRLTGEVLAGPLRRGEPVTDVRVVGPGLWSQVPPGQVAAPVRLADLAVAALLHPGDRVDVLATSADAGAVGIAGTGAGGSGLGGSGAGGSGLGAAEVVAGDALVLSAPAVPAPGTAPVADGGLLVLAVPAETAARLAAAATNSTLTVTFGAP